MDRLKTHLKIIVSLLDIIVEFRDNILRYGTARTKEKTPQSKDRCCSP